LLLPLLSLLPSSLLLSLPLSLSSPSSLPHDSNRFQIDINVFHHALYRSHASGSINPWNGFVVVMCASLRSISNNSAVPG
jgi:hypothetical protein